MACSPQVEVPPASSSDAKEATKNPSPVWRFDDTPPGRLAQGFVTGEAATRGNPATWAVIEDETAPSPPGAFAVTKSHNKGANFQVALASDGPRFADVDVEVALKSIGGTHDRGGGPVWRAQGPGDYYTARWNPLEGNFRVYVVVAESRSKLAEVDVEADETQWHSIRAVMQGSRIEAFFDGELLLELDDPKISEAGMVGLWTKSDSLAAFDDLRVQEP